MVDGWGERYSEIVEEFGFSTEEDYRAACMLDSIIKNPVQPGAIGEIISGRSVFVIGAGPSLPDAIPVLRRYENPKIAADSAVRVLIEGGILPDIVVTDLDGDEDSLRRAADRAIMMVHAHGDNADRLHLAGGFRRCIGTAQGRTTGSVRNFGGFTDGDRCVFVADAFGADRIVLFGMDLDGGIGASSGTKPQDERAKLQKLRRAKSLLEWLAARTGSGLYTVSGRIGGFESIDAADLGRVA